MGTIRISEAKCWGGALQPDLTFPDDDDAPGMASGSTGTVSTCESQTKSVDVPGSFSLCCSLRCRSRLGLIRNVSPHFSYSIINEASQPDFSILIILQ